LRVVDAPSAARDAGSGSLERPKGNPAADGTRIERGSESVFHPCSIRGSFVSHLSSLIPLLPHALRGEGRGEGFSGHCTLCLTLVNIRDYSFPQTGPNPLRRNALGGLRFVHIVRRRTGAAKPVRRRKSLQAHDLGKSAFDRGF
jgi:hypothetical protein